MRNGIAYAHCMNDEIKTAPVINAKYVDNSHPTETMQYHLCNGPVFANPINKGVVSDMFLLPNYPMLHTG